MLVGALHIGVIAGLIYAFAPRLDPVAADPRPQTFQVSVASPTPEPPPEARREASQKQGRQAPAGLKAIPRPAQAPRPRLRVASQTAPVVEGTGHADSAGATTAGEGPGAGGTGQGTGAGGTGDGPGGGGAARVEKIAGDIVSAKDYPKETRDLRLGQSVIIALTVGVDGKVSACRVVQASRDPEADRITCRLASDRFRFRPARDASGRAIVSIYGWQQRWFTPERR